MAIYRPKYSRKTDPGRRLAGRIFGAGAPFRQWIARLLPKRRTAGAGFSAAGRSRHIKGTHLLVAVAVVLAVLAGGTVFYHRLAASDVFRLTELEVSGNRIVERREIVEQSGLHQGVGLLGHDLEAARMRIEDLAWIDTARLRVVWPARVEITVREHRVLALVHQAGDRGGGLSYLDDKGRLFARVRPGQEIDYPVITGLPPEKQNDEQGGQSLRDKAIKLLRLAARGNAILPIQAISEVHCDRDKGLVLYLVDHPFPIYMGRENISTRYYRLIRILDRLYRKKKIAGIREIHMDYMEHKVLVAMAGPGRK